MSAPKCKLCGANHWNNEPHRWQETPKQASDPKPPKQADKKPTVKKQANGLELPEKASKRALQWQRDNRERYNEYKREYMKAYRKRKKPH